MQTASSVLTRAVFVAYGTRGDVQPLACLACHLQHSYPGVQATLVTHEAHKVDTRVTRGLLELFRVQILLQHRLSKLVYTLMHAPAELAGAGL